MFCQIDEILQTPFTRPIFEGTEEWLRQTVNAQPAILAVSLACLAAMEEVLTPDHMPKPMFVAGHSLGEYTALKAAGVLSLPEVVCLVSERARLMHRACQEKVGGMTALIGLDEPQVEEICSEAGTYIANINSWNVIVISGEHAGLTRAADLAWARGALRVIPLQVSGPFHSVQMESARAGMVDATSHLGFHDPEVPIVANSTGEPMITVEAVRDEIIAQICKPVRWYNSIQFMISAGVKTFIEVGPGMVLTKLVRNIASDLRAVNVCNVADFSVLQAN